VVIERALILAAGRGTRLGEITRRRSKPMLEIGTRPLIGHLADAIAAAGIRSLTVITGYLAETVEEYLAATSPLPVSFIRQPHRNGTAGAVRLARHALGDDPFLLSWGDIATEPLHYAQVMGAWRPGLAAAVGVNVVPDVAMLSSYLFGDDMRITEIVEKPEAPAPSLWNGTGILCLSSRVWDFVDVVGPSVRNELEMPDVLTAMAEAGHRLEAVPLDGPWFDIGTPASLAAARATFGG